MSRVLSFFFQNAINRSLSLCKLGNKYYEKKTTTSFKSEYFTICLWLHITKHLVYFLCGYFISSFITKAFSQHVAGLKITDFIVFAVKYQLSLDCKI